MGWLTTIHRLTTLRNYENDWDGEGSPAPSREVVEFSLDLAETMLAMNIRPPTVVLPSANGNVYFEWHVTQGYLEVEVISGKEMIAHFLPRGSLTPQIL